MADREVSDTSTCMFPPGYYRIAKNVCSCTIHANKRSKYCIALLRVMRQRNCLKNQWVVSCTTERGEGRARIHHHIGGMRTDSGQRMARFGK